LRPELQTFQNKKNQKEEKKHRANADLLEPKDKTQTTVKSLAPPILNLSGNSKATSGGGEDTEEKKKNSTSGANSVSGGSAAASPPNTIGNNPPDNGFAKAKNNGTAKGNRAKDPFKKTTKESVKISKPPFKLNFQDRNKERQFFNAFAVGSTPSKTTIEKRNYTLPKRKANLQTENLKQILQGRPNVFDILNANNQTKALFDAVLSNEQSVDQLIKEFQMPEKFVPGQIGIEGAKEKEKQDNTEQINPKLDDLIHETSLLDESIGSQDSEELRPFNINAVTKQEEEIPPETQVKEENSNETEVPESDEVINETEETVENITEEDNQLDTEQSEENSETPPLGESPPTDQPPVEQLTQELQGHQETAENDSENLSYPEIFDNLIADFHLVIADSVEFEKQEIDADSLPVQDEEEKRQLKNDLDHKANEDKTEADRRVNRLMYNTTDKAKSVTEKAKEIPAEIESARAQAESIVSAAAGEQKGAITSAFAGFKASVNEQKGGIIGQIESQHQSTVAAIEGTYTTNAATVETEYGVAVGQINTALAATMAAVESIYTTAAGEMRTMGADFAAQAKAVASEAATEFRSDVSDEAEIDANAQNEARAQAAEQTGQAVAQSMIEQANSAADALMQSMAVAQQEAQGVAAAELATLEGQYTEASQELETAKQSAIQQADTAKTSNIEAVNLAAEGAIQSLEAQESGQLEGIDTMSSQSIAQIAEMAAESTENLQNSAVETLEQFRDDLINVKELTDGAPAPAKEEIEGRIKPYEDKLNMSIEGIEKVVTQGLDDTKQGIIDIGTQSASKLSNLAAQAIAGGQEAVGSFTSSVQEILGAAQQALSQAQAGHEQESSSITTEAIAGFGQTVASAQEQLQAIESRSQTEASGAVDSLQGALSSMLSSLAGMIASNAETAAAAVPTTAGLRSAEGAFTDVERSRQEAEDRLLNADENTREKIINPETGGAYTDEEMAEALGNAEQRKSDEITAAENRLLTADDDLREHLINPETGGAYTDEEMNTAIENAENRRLDEINIAEDRVRAADENTREKIINPETGGAYTDAEIAAIMSNDGNSSEMEDSGAIDGMVPGEEISEIQLTADNILEEQAMFGADGEMLSDTQLEDLIVSEVIGNLSDGNADFVDLETTDEQGVNLTETSLLLAGQIEGLPPDLQMRVLEEGSAEIGFIVENMTTLEEEGVEAVYGNLAHIAEVTGIEGAEELATLFIENSGPIQEYIEESIASEDYFFGPGYFLEDEGLLSAMNNSAANGNGSLLSYAISETLYADGHNTIASQIFTRTTSGVDTARDNFNDIAETHTNRMSELSHLVQDLQLGGFSEEAINGAIETYMQEHAVDFDNYEEQSANYASTLQGAAYAIDHFTDAPFVNNGQIDNLHSTLYQSTDLINSDAGREVLADTILKSGYGQRTWMDTARDNSARYDARSTEEAGDTTDFITFSEKMDTSVMVGADLGLQALGSTGDASSVDSFITGLSTQLAYSDPVLAEAMESARGDITSTFNDFYSDNNPNPIGLVRSIGGVFSKIASNKELDLSEDQKTTLARFGTALSIGTSVLNFVEDPTVPGGIGISNSLIGVYKKTLEAGDFVEGIDVESLTLNSENLSWSQLSKRGKLGIVSEGLGAASSIYKAWDNPEFKTIFNAVFETSEFASQFAALNGKPGAAKLLGKAGTFITLAFSGFELIKAINEGDTEGAIKAGLPLAGALIGSLIPGVGTALGLAIGSLIAIGIDVVQHIFGTRPDEHYEDNTDEAIMAAVLIESMNAGYDLDELGLDYNFDVTSLEDIKTIMENGPFSNLVKRFRDVDNDFNSVWPVIGKISDSTNRPLGNLLVSLSYFEDDQLNFLAKFMLETDQKVPGGGVVYSDQNIDAIKGIIDFISPGTLPGTHDMVFDEVFFINQGTTLFHESGHDMFLNATITDEMIYGAYYMKYFIGGNSQLSVEDIMVLLISKSTGYESFDLTDKSDLNYIYDRLTDGDLQWTLLENGSARPQYDPSYPIEEQVDYNDEDKVELAREWVSDEQQLAGIDFTEDVEPDTINEGDVVYRFIPSSYVEDGVDTSRLEGYFFTNLEDAQYLGLDLNGKNLVAIRAPQDIPVLRSTTSNATPWDSPPGVDGLRGGGTQYYNGEAGLWEGAEVLDNYSQEDWEELVGTYYYPIY